jgi:hypothetical protein
LKSWLMSLMAGPSRNGDCRSLRLIAQARNASPLA